MHKTIGLVVATICSLAAGAAIIWQTEQGWSRSLAGDRTPVTATDLHDSLPVNGSSQSLVTKERPTSRSEKPANFADLGAPQSEPGSQFGTAASEKQNEPATTDLFDVWAAGEKKQSDPTPTPSQVAGNQFAADQNPWGMAASGSSGSKTEFEPVPKKEMSKEPAVNSATDLWGMGGVTTANHQQPENNPGDVQLTQHESVEPMPAAFDPFMSSGNSEPAPTPAATAVADPFDSAPTPVEPNNVMALFPDSPAPAPVPENRSASAQLEPATQSDAFPSFGGFPEPKAAASEPTPAPMFPDLAPAPAPAANNNIRLTQAEEPPAVENPPAPIPKLEEPAPSMAPGNSEPTGPAPDPFFNFGGEPPAPANPPTPIPNAEPAPAMEPRPVPMPAADPPSASPAILPEFEMSPAPPANPNSTPAPNNLFPGIDSPVPVPNESPRTNPSIEKPIQRPLAEDSMIGAGVINENVPRVLQRPELSLEKKAPSTAALGEPMVYTIEVKNTGTITAKEVTLEDEIPKGSKLTGTIPQAHMKEKTLIWKLGDLKPGDSQLVKVRVIPLEEGDIGSVATVHFMTEVAAATRITAPVLQLVMEATPQIAIGEDATIRYKIKNVGEGTAFNVTLYSLIPQNLKHPEGVDLEMPIGTLEAGQSKEVALVAAAELAGRGINQAQVKATGNVTAEGKADIEVIESVLTVERTGPARRFVGHNAAYTITVSNQSIRDIEQATIVETVPQGFEFVSATANGKYNPSTRAVTWNYGKLRAKSQESMQITLRPDRVGEFASEVAVVSKDGHKASVAAKTTVEGFASLKIEDPEGKGLVGVGEQISLRFKVKNRGSAPANGVQITCNVPSNFQVLSANGPSKYRQDGNRLTFDAVAAIAPDQDMQVDFVLVAKAAGETNLSIAVNAQEMKDALNHEEHLVVYNPNE